MISKLPSNSNVLPSPFLLMSQHKFLLLLVPGLCAQRQKDGVGDVCTDEPFYLLIVLKQRHGKELGPYTEFKGLKVRWKVFSVLLRSVVLGGGGRKLPS